MSDDDLRRYLLGELRPEERERVEVQYLADDSVHERLLAMEDEVLDDYAGGSLAPDKSRYVKETLLVTREGNERLNFSKALATVIRTQSPAAAQDSRIPLIMVMRLWGAWRVLVPATAAIVLSIVLVALWYGLSRTGKSPAAIARNGATSSPINRAPSSKSVPPTVPLPLLAFALHPISRGAESIPNIVRLPPEAVRIVLQTDIPGNASGTYRAFVQSIDSSASHEAARVSAARLQAGIVRVSAEFPSVVLENGDFILRIKLVVHHKALEEVAALSFALTRRDK